MEMFIGIDAHKEACQIAVLPSDGIEQTDKGTRYSFAWNRKVPSRPKALGEALKEYSGCVVLMEASTSSRPIAAWLRELGLKVIVADPNYKMMYASRRAGTKTDRTDAEALAVALSAGHYRAIHETSADQYRRKKLIGVRARIVSQRTENKNIVHATYAAAGLTLSSSQLVKLMAADASDDLTEVHERVRELVEPCLIVGRTINKQIAALDEKIYEIATHCPDAKLLMAIPGVGPVLAVAFVAAIDGVERFEDAGKISSYFGLTPSIYASAGKETTGGISKRGSKQIRTLLMQAILGFARSNDPRVKDLVAWRDAIAKRRGRKLANTALSRRLAEIMYAMLRDRTPFGSPKPRRTKATKTYVLNTNAAVVA